MGRLTTMKRVLLGSLPLVYGALGITISSIASAQDAPNYVNVRSISYAGSGCPAGSVSQNISADMQAFTLLFDGYIAEVGPNVPFAQKRKNCQINVDFAFPQGWSYALVTFDYRGYVSLQPNVFATQQSSYYFQGNIQTARFRTPMAGPIDRDYQVRDHLELNTQVWSPCGDTRSLNINSEVRLDNSRNPNGRGVITVDSVDGAIAQTYGFAWRRCR